VNGERLAKRIARAGVCSRREAEKLIAAGRVKVDGRQITSPALNVTPSQRVEVDGRALEKAERARLWLYHKPAGLVTTHKDPEGRPTVFQHLPPGLPRVISVGRLDLTSEGLLLLTNDGALARQLELPANGWARRYRARVYGKVSPDMIASLKKGQTVEGVHYGSVEVEVERGGSSNTWVQVTLAEGKNREIRKLFAHFHCTVNRLIRTAFGPFELEALPPGEVKEVSAKMLEKHLSA